jgi:hypothetical protein
VRGSRRAVAASHLVSARAAATAATHTSSRGSFATTQSQRRRSEKCGMEGHRGEGHRGPVGPGRGADDTPRQPGAPRGAEGLRKTKAHVAKQHVRGRGSGGAGGPVVSSPPRSSSSRSWGRSKKVESRHRLMGVPSCGGMPAARVVGGTATCPSASRGGARAGSNVPPPCHRPLFIPRKFEGERNAFSPPPASRRGGARIPFCRQFITIASRRSRLCARSLRMTRRAARCTGTPITASG